MMRILLFYFARLHRFLHAVKRRILILAYRTQFNRCGSQVTFDPLNSVLAYSRINIGNFVFIGGNAWFSAEHSFIRIGSYVMFGPGVTILGGDHEYRKVGIPMFLVKDKEKSLDQDVVIEDDVWIGANVTILKGVRVGRGAIVAAGSLVTRDIPPYSICLGMPAKKIKDRFDEEVIKEHELKLKNYDL